MGICCMNEQTNLYWAHVYDRGYYLHFTDDETEAQRMCDVSMTSQDHRASGQMAEQEL